MVQEEESHKHKELKYKCRCSFLEIYNEQISDLLEPASTNLPMREDMNKGVYVEGLLEVEVQNVQDVLHLLLLVRLQNSKLKSKKQGIVCITLKNPDLIKSLKKSQSIFFVIRGVGCD